MTTEEMEQNLMLNEAELVTIDALLDEHKHGGGYLIIAFREGIKHGIVRERQRQKGNEQIG
jgi:hypothetical protein